MKIILTLLSLLIIQSSFSQTTFNSKAYGALEFKELDYGLAKVREGTTENLKASPTGTHGWLADFEIIKTTDSVQAIPNAKFGVVYIINAAESMDLAVTIEWIYPRKITNEKGQHFKSIKYQTTRPTNTPSASSYSFDESYELIKGNWQLNIIIENKRVCHKTFIVY